ncbi:hypothetical protein Trydic_g17644 [Trypoxylus dichotomus]
MIPEFCKLINENLLDIENILSHTNVTWNKKILDCIGSVSDKVVFKIYLDFINIDVVDTIFKTKSNAIRDSLIDFVLLKDSFSINCYDMEEQKRITSRLKDSYVGKIDELRIQNNMDWYKLCMFTMKYCGKLLHSEIELTNIILHYVEIGFKTKTVQDRLLSYDCWKLRTKVGCININCGSYTAEPRPAALKRLPPSFATILPLQVLIDICNLDSSYISNPKQLRLLIKPLKIKLSKNEEVVQKRFDIWFYLATILQEKILHCVEELVKFCFEMKDSGITSEICIDSNIIKDTWLKRVEILISIIGHYEDDSNCLKIENFNFTNPIVSCSNFPKLDNLLLNSIYVSCKIISKWDSGSYKRMKIRCLWGSTFKIIQNLNEKIKEDVLHNVSEVLQLILQDCITKNMYFKDILMPIFSLLSSFKEPICNPSVFNEIIIFPIIRFMLFQQMLDPAWSKEVIDLIRHIPKAGNKPFYFNRISELLKTSPQVNNSFVILFWLYIIEELYDICKMPRENFSDFNEDAMFLLTLILTWNNLEEIQNFVLSAWKRTFSEICTISNVFGEDFLRNCENLLKLHPETGINILTILPDISEILFNNKSYKKFVVAPSLLNVIHLCLQNPDIRKSKILLLIPILKKIFSFCTGGDTVEATSVVLKMCKCIEYILKLHRIYEILEFLKEIAPKLSTNIKKKLPNSLKATIKNLATNDNNIPSKDAVEVLSQFDEKETERNAQVFVRPVSTRSAKIANMAKDNAHSASLNENMLKIFSNEVRKSQEDNVIMNDVSSSIKLRISITNEDNNLEQSIIKQLDAEISNIDANLQSNICLLNRKNNLVTNSESIFESLDTLGKSEQLNLQDCNQSKVIKNEPLNHKNVKKNAISLKDSGGEIDTSRIKEEQVVTKTRKQRELDRIKMDIVGADEFVITTPRKRRASRLTFAKKEKSSNGIPTQTIIERKTGKNKGNSFNSPIHTLKVTPENSDIKVVLGSRSNCIVTAKNKWEQTKLKSYNSSIDRDNISLDQDKRNKIPNKAKVKSKSITNSITSLKNGSHRRKKKQERKANVSAKIEIDSMPTAMIFNNQEANNINLNVSISGQEPFIVSSSATTLQENSTAYALRNKNKAEDSQNATEPLISTSNDNLFESVIQRIDLHSEDDTNQEVDKVEYDRPGLEDGQISFSTLNELLNVKKLETLADIACNNVVNNESTLDNSSTSFKETKSDNKSSSILSETDEITESVQSKTLNIEVIGPDVPTTPAISSADSYAIQKSLPYKKETFSQNETLTCNPYINIYKEKDVVDKLEKYCPGAIETLIKDLDFEDLPLTFETPKRENILCSPLCDDTPDKNKELVKNTSDISPIKLEFTESRICERNMTPTENDKPCIKNASSRSTKLLNLLSSPSNLTSKVLQSPRKFQPELSSLSTQRVHKIISKCQPPIEKQDDIVSHKSLSISFITEEQNVLKFTRELPSPLAAPSTSILKKRKFSDVTDDISLYSKRTKRVNFSDPPTTSQKIYFTEKEEKTSDGKTDKSLSFISELNALKASSICPKLATCTIDINDVVTLLSRDLVKHFHSANIRTVGDLASLNDSQVSQLEFLGEPRLERITEALDAISRNYCKEKDGFPICVDLVDCSHSLDKLCAIDNSFKTFHSNNIRTIGDLAKLTKPEKYHRMLNKKKILTKQMQEERNERGICTEVTETNILQDNFDGSIAPVRETAPCDALANKEVLRRTVSEEIQYIKKQYSSDEIRDIFIHLRDIVRGKFELNK